MVKEFIRGGMEENMTESINMIKNMDLVYILGLMVENMKVIGLMEGFFLLKNNH